MIVFLLNEMTCAVVGNRYILSVFLRLISTLRLKFLIARLFAIKIFNRPAALLIKYATDVKALTSLMGRILVDS